MKYIILLSLLVSTWNVTFAETTKKPTFSISEEARFPIDSVVLYLSQMNLYSFQNRPIDSFIAKIPSGYLSMKVRPADKLTRASVLVISYENKIVIDIYVREFEHMDPNNPNKLHPDLAWSPENFRKEKAAYIKIYKGVDCINGCEY